jgi:alpha-L-fucosidase 2
MARLGDGEAALENLREMFSHFTLPNLFNNGPPFQIDGNFGALSGITQMLIQSRIRYSDSGSCVVLDLLPALPQSWGSGRLQGARAKGNFELDFAWHDGKIDSLVIRNQNAFETAAVLRLPGNEPRDLRLPSGETVLI